MDASEEPTEEEPTDETTDAAASIEVHNPTAQATCKAPDGTTTTIDGTVAAGSETTFDMTLDTSSLVAGSVCVVRVTNEDGSYYDYSALGITNPSLNLTAFVAGTDMTTARIAPAVASGRATNSARFVYAIGGSDGANALSSVESAPIDIFGAPGTGKSTIAGGVIQLVTSFGLSVMAIQVIFFMVR